MVKRVKKAKPKKLSEMSVEQLQNLCRSLRDQRNTARDELTATKERLTLLRESDRQLREENAQLIAANDRLQSAFDELNEQFELAKNNNTKLQGVVEAAGEDGLDFGDSLMAQLFERLDIIIGALGGQPPSYLDADADDDDDGDEAPMMRFPSRGERADDFAEDEDEESDDDADEDGEEDEDGEHADEWERNNPTPEEIAEGSELLPVHGIDAAVEGETRADAVITASEEALRAEGEASEEPHTGEEPVASVISEDQLTELVSPAIKAVVDGFENYEDTILKAIQSGGMSKELALRTIVAQAYPQHPEMADAILNAQTTRDAVYELMAL